MAKRQLRFVGNPVSGNVYSSKTGSVNTPALFSVLALFPDAKLDGTAAELDDTSLATFTRLDV